MTRALNILRSLNPAAALFGPIFQKEVRTAGRKRFTYWLRFLFAAGLLAIVGLVLSGMRDSVRGLSGLQRFQTLQEFAPYVTMVVVWFQFVTVALMAPILAAPAVCEEKRARTLPALMTTPLTSGQIAFGKLAARLVQLVILSLLSAPLLLAIRIFGGLEAEVILAAACISVSTAILGAALGLMYSVWHRRASTAAMFALFTLVLVQGGPTTLQSILYFNLTDAGNRGPFPSGVLTTCSPATLAQVQGALMFGMPLFGGADPREMWIINSIYNVAIGLGVALLASVALRRAMLREASGDLAASTSAGPSRPSRAARAVDPAAHPTLHDEPAAEPPGDALETPPDSSLVAHRSSSREVSDHPVLWREVRLRTFGSRRAFRVIAALTALIFLLLYVFAGLWETGTHGTILVIAALAVMVQSVFLTSGGISGERESSTWEVLIASPLSATQIILGKFLGSLKAQWFIPGVVLAHLALSAAIGAVHPVLILHAAAILAGPVLFFSATGLLLSLVLRRSVTASVVNLLLAIMLWAGSWIAAALIAWFFDLGTEDWYDHVWQACYCANPVPMVMTAAEPGVQEGGFGDFRGPRLYRGGDLLRLHAGGFTFLVLAVFAGYAGAGVACLLTAIRAFTRLSGRSS